MWVNVQMFMLQKRKNRELILQLPHVVSIEKNDKGIIRPLVSMDLCNIVVFLFKFFFQEIYLFIFIEG